MYKSLRKNISELKAIANNSADFTVRNLVLTNGVKCAVFTTEGMCDKENLAVYVINPLLNAEFSSETGEKLFDNIFESVLSGSEIILIENYDDALYYMMSGFALVSVDGCEKMLAVGAQGFAYRGVSEPESELVQRGSREGFTEALKINMTLIRRRLKNPSLVFETLSVGSESNTQGEGLQS